MNIESKNILSKHINVYIDAGINIHTYETCS